MISPLDRLQTALGYRFEDAGLLTQALTHRSFSSDNGERLEFLGDGWVNFWVGEALYRARPQADEGELSRLRASLVCESALAKIALQLNLGDALRLGGGELKSGGYRRESVIADALEAVLGAVVLDGGFPAANAVAERLFAEVLQNLPSGAALKDAKTRLQEWLQGRGRPLPEYRLLSSEGPSHRQTFTVACVLVDSAQQTQAEGVSRKLAEQKAAELMLLTLETGTSE